MRAVIRKVDGPLNSRTRWYCHDDQGLVLHSFNDKPACICTLDQILYGLSHPYQAWYHYGTLHRKDAPAVFHSSGSIEYWVCGYRVRSISKKLQWPVGLVRVWWGIREAATGGSL